MQQYAGYIAATLQEIFPTSLSDIYDRFSLGLQGIDDVIFQTSPLTGNPEIIPSQNQISLTTWSMGLLLARETALDFFNGTRGTACN
ncbi:MAG: hypothetical protein WDO16_11095 [Bacteroidota bacterium]